VVITYYGLLGHGRVPVMLNFTSGPANITAALRAAGVKKVLSAKRFVTQAKLEDLIAAIEAGRRGHLAR
jgi:acyl-[acyl-carrier-protein]-phospholipid O-acyltransferase/long-chain-fatty-acid--[acyl-carrier-protein] ligase